LGADLKLYHPSYVRQGYLKWEGLFYSVFGQQNILHLTTLNLALGS